MAAIPGTGNDLTPGASDIMNRPDPVYQTSKPAPAFGTAPSPSSAAIPTSPINPNKFNVPAPSTNAYVPDNGFNSDGNDYTPTANNYAPAPIKTSAGSETTAPAPATPATAPPPAATAPAPAAPATAAPAPTTAPPATDDSIPGKLGLKATAGGAISIGGIDYIGDATGKWVPKDSKNPGTAATTGAGGTGQAPANPGYLGDPRFNSALFGGTSPYAPSVTNQMVNGQTATFADPSNPNINYMTPEGAAKIAQMFGGKVVEQNQDTNPVPGTNVPMYGLDFGNGGDVQNVGQIAFWLQRGDSIDSIKSRLQAGIAPPALGSGAAGDHTYGQDNSGDTYYKRNTPDYDGGAGGVGFTPQFAQGKQNLTFADPAALARAAAGPQIGSGATADPILRATANGQNPVTQAPPPGSNAIRTTNTALNSLGAPAAISIQDQVSQLLNSAAANNNPKPLANSDYYPDYEPNLSGTPDNRVPNNAAVGGVTPQLTAALTAYSSGQISIEQLLSVLQGNAGTATASRTVGQ